MKIVILGGRGLISSAITGRSLEERHDLSIFERPQVALYHCFSDEEYAEWHPTNSLVPHGIMKLVIVKYHLSLQHLYDLKFTVLRVANPFGVFLSKAIQNQSFEIGVAIMSRKILCTSAMLPKHWQKFKRTVRPY
jgi:hypothetical protein